MPTFAGRVAVVTGGGTGIGREIARRLALQGARVLLNDVDLGRAEEAAGKIAAEGGVCRPAGGDGADVAVVRGLVEQAVQAFGRLDLAVANAGLTLYGDFFAYEPDAFDRLVAVNLMMARARVVELSPYGIAINAVAPGATVTPRTAADPEWEAGWARATPLGRPAKVADVAAAALFLLSPGASHITGQALIVDGGWTSLGAAPERA